MTRRQRRERTARRRRHVAASAGLAVGATFAAPAVAHATDFPVTNLHDTGAGSLRQAITDANSNSGADRILFQSGLSGTIQIGSTIMPPITESVEILGPGANQLTI